MALRRSAVAGLLVAPGASAGRDSRTMVALERGLEVPVCRVDVKARAVPKVLAGLRSDLERFCGEIGAEPERVVLGGRSFGGRMCSMLVAQGEPAAGLALLSYPLHPPGRPDQLRTDHFPRLAVPCLFVSGTRDPFGSPDELRAAAVAISGPVTHEWVEGQGHSPRDDGPVVAAVARWIASL